MTLKTNLKELKSYARSGPVSNRPRIQKIIELYSSRKIPKLKTALNAVLLLASNHKLTVSSNKAVKAYGQLMTKYEVRCQSLEYSAEQPRGRDRSSMWSSSCMAA